MLNVSNASAKELVQEVASRAVESKVVAAAVAGSTAALGLSDIQSYAQLAATIAAFLLSVTLIVKHGFDVYRQWKKAKEEDEEQS
jgi:hypothetical protein